MQTCRFSVDLRRQTQNICVIATATIIDDALMCICVSFFCRFWFALFPCVCVRVFFRCLDRYFIVLTIQQICILNKMCPLTRELKRRVEFGRSVDWKCFNDLLLVTLSFSLAVVFFSLFLVLPRCARKSAYKMKIYSHSYDIYVDVSIWMWFRLVSLLLIFFCSFVLFSLLSHHFERARKKNEKRFHFRPM